MVQNYKCPNCGADVVFDTRKQMMVCPYCDSELQVDEILEDQPNAELIELESEEEADALAAQDCRGEDFEEPAFGVREGESLQETADFHAFQCKNCGAQLMTEDATAATFCSFCGSPALIENRLSGELKPTRLIPFQISKEEAVAKYREWTKKGILTPGVFRKEATLEKISGVYVPYFLYDYEADVQLEATAKRIRIRRRGDIEYIYTDHYRVYRHMGLDFDQIPADASKNMPDALMECLEPFRHEEMKTFEMPYLSGFLAEKYTEDVEELKTRIEPRVEKCSESVARDTIRGYNAYHVVRQQIQKKCQAVEYVLLPVWMLNYRYKNKTYTFALNGQTGKMTANLPISKGKVAGIFCGLTTLIALLLTLCAG